MESVQRRSSLEVIADILRLKEASKTRIMYSCNMSYHQLQRYLQILLARGFLEKVIVPNPGVKYRITEQGKALLEAIDQVTELLKY